MEKEIEELRSLNKSLMEQLEYYRFKEVDKIETNNEADYNEFFNSLMNKSVGQLKLIQQQLCASTLNSNADEVKFINKKIDLVNSLIAGYYYQYNSDENLASRYYHKKQLNFKRSLLDRLLGL